MCSKHEQLKKSPTHSTYSVTGLSVVESGSHPNWSIPSRLVNDALQTARKNTSVAKHGRSMTSSPMLGNVKLWTLYNVHPEFSKPKA
jgi:hypothetical protein